MNGEAMREIGRLLRKVLALVVAAQPLFPLAIGAQHSHAPSAADSSLQGAVDHDMSTMAGHDHMASAHMRLTPLHRPSAGDSARAARLLVTLRASIEKYADTSAALAEGYRIFAPEVKTQRVWHYTHWGHAVRNAFGFDPARPTSLLYERGANGRLHLVGAMYTAPRRASLADLDERVPLSMTHWHLHTNICTPPLRARERWRETHDGQPVFGPASPISTREACESVGGRFHDSIFNWMVHVNVFSDRPWQ